VQKYHAFTLSIRRRAIDSDIAIRAAASTGGAEHVVNDATGVALGTDMANAIAGIAATEIVWTAVCPIPIKTVCAAAETDIHLRLYITRNIEQGTAAATGNVSRREAMHLVI